MEFLIPFLIPPAAFAALMAALYYIYPSPLVHGYNKFGGYFIAGLSRKYRTINNITYCYYEREAEPDPKPTDKNGHPKTFLFLHGYTGSKIMWMTMVRYLPKEWRLILVDLPGHGESSFEEGAKYDCFGFADKIHEFITSLDLYNLHLIGCSLGALITATYASLHPKSDRLSSITLMCPPGTHKFPRGVKTEFLEYLERGKNKVMPTDADEFQEMMDMVLYDSSKFTFPLRFRQALVEAQLPNYPNFTRIQHDLADMNKNETQETVKQMASNISIPTLVLWGDHDKVCHPSGADIMSELIERSHVVIVERCGHAMTLDRPRKCAKLVQSFINSTH